MYNSIRKISLFMVVALMSMQLYGASESKTEDDSIRPAGVTAQPDITSVNDKIINALGIDLGKLGILYTSLRTLSPVDERDKQLAHTILNDIIYKLLRNNTGPRISKLLLEADSLTGHALSDPITNLIWNFFWNKALDNIVPGMADFRSFIKSASIETADTLAENRKLPFFDALRSLVISPLIGGMAGSVDFTIARFAADPDQGDFGGMLQRLAGQVADQMQDIRQHVDVIGLRTKREATKALKTEAEATLQALKSRKIEAKADLDRAITAQKAIEEREREDRSSVGSIVDVCLAYIESNIRDSDQLSIAKAAKTLCQDKLNQIKTNIASEEGKKKKLEEELHQLTNDIPAWEEFGRFENWEDFYRFKNYASISITSLAVANRALKGQTLSQELEVPSSIIVRAFTMLFQIISPYVEQVIEIVGGVPVDAIPATVTREVDDATATMRDALLKLKSQLRNPQGDILMDMTGVLRPSMDILRIPLKEAQYIFSVMPKFVSMARALMMASKPMLVGTMVQLIHKLLTSIFNLQTLSSTTDAALVAGSYVGVGATMYLEQNCKLTIDPFVGACAGGIISVVGSQISYYTGPILFVNGIFGWVGITMAMIEDTHGKKTMGQLLSSPMVVMTAGLAIVTPIIDVLASVGTPGTVLGLAIGAAVVGLTDYNAARTLFYEVPAGLLSKVAGHMWWALESCFDES